MKKISSEEAIEILEEMERLEGEKGRGHYDYVRTVFRDLTGEGPFGKSKEEIVDVITQICYAAARGEQELVEELVEARLDALEEGKGNSAKKAELGLSKSATKEEVVKAANERLVPAILKSDTNWTHGSASVVGSRGETVYLKSNIYKYLRKKGMVV